MSTIWLPLVQILYEIRIYSLFFPFILLFFKIVSWFTYLQKEVVDLVCACVCVI